VRAVLIVLVLTGLVWVVRPDRLADVLAFVLVVGLGASVAMTVFLIRRARDVVRLDTGDTPAASDSAEGPR
jgi:hypothetical protein